MQAEALPEPIITRFRTLSLERIGRVETVWQNLIQGGDDHEAVRAISRDLHTLKGDAKIVGFEEVHVLAQKLEELLAAAGQVQYRVSEDFDLVVTMAAQFVGMLLRKKARDAVGIDLAGFVRQVDEILREARLMRRTHPTVPRIQVRTNELSTDRISEDRRHRLAVVATDAFLEYLSQRNGRSRARLRGIWQTLSGELQQLHSVALEPLLSRHVAAARGVAADLGKQVELQLAVGNVRLESRVMEAVDVAVLHLVRNALDHGIESPAVRVAAGKPERGRITIDARDTDDWVEIAVEDDGAGIDLAAVRAKAVARGLMDEARAQAASDAELLDLLFRPGFSTRDEVTELSGRGVGMDAVKAGITKVGGRVRLVTRPGAGSTVVLSVPPPTRQLRVYHFLAPGNALNLAISARWAPTTDSKPCDDAIDPLSALQLGGGSRQTINGVVAAPQDLIMRLRWGFLEIAVRTATEPVLTIAERICPTPDDHPVEVVQVDGVEVLMLRPDRIADLFKRARAGS